MVTNSCCGGAVPITDAVWSMNCLFFPSCYLKDVWKFSLILMSLILAVSYKHFVYKIKIICWSDEL